MIKQDRERKITKILIAIAIILTLGLYLGIDVQEMCRQQYSQKAIRIAIEKPFLNRNTFGLWNFYIGIGEKREDKPCQWMHESFLKYGYKPRGVWLK